MYTLKEHFLNDYIHWNTVYIIHDLGVKYLYIHVQFTLKYKENHRKYQWTVI